MPGTPRRPRRTPQRGVTDTLEKENFEPPAAPIDSPGGIMAKRKDRLSRRYSVLKVLGQTAISPGVAEDDGSSGPAGAAKKRRNSRVSFGHIQTAVFKKDGAEHSPSPARGSKGTVQLNTNNLSALPDDTVFGSPAGGSDAGSEAMDITMGVTGTQALASLPPISDMTADASFASFADENDRSQDFDQQQQQQQQQAGKPIMSLADLVADDECSYRPMSGAAMEFSATSHIFRANDCPSSVGGDKAADLTDHDLTADIKGPGDNTRRLADHTGAFMASEQTIALRSRGNRDSGVMELTTAYGGIVSHAMQDSDMEETCAMELTTAYGGIVGGAGRLNKTEKTARMSLAGQELTGILSKIRGAKGGEEVEEEEEEEEEEEAVRDAVGAKEMGGSFARILSSATRDTASGSPDTLHEEDEALGGAKLSPKTFHDDEVTMFTPLSRIKKRMSRRPSMAGEAQLDDSTASGSCRNGDVRVSPPNAAHLRLPDAAAPSTLSLLASAEKAVRASGGPNRRRSVRGGAGAVERIDSVDKFLEEVGIRFLTNVKQHNSRKSSICALPLAARADATLSLHDKLLQVFTIGTELGQTEKNSKKLREMLNTLSDGMQQLEEAVNRKNPAVFEQLSLEDTEADDALAVKKRMKALKKLCRSRAETRWVQWREQAQLKVHEALQKNVQALSDDVGVLDTYLGAVRAAIASVRQAQRAAALVELQAQLQQLADTESESALALHALRSQVEALAAKKQAAVDTVEALQEAVAAAQAPASDDSMLLAQEAVSEEQVAHALQLHEALQALAPWGVARLSPDECAIDLPSARRLQLRMSPIGAVTHVFFQDLRAGSRDEWERVLWAESGVEALLRDLKSFKDLPAALPEVMLRVCRMHALQRELDALARRFSIQRLVSGDGRAVVRATAINAPRNAMLAVDMQVQWHYPAGKIAYTSQWLVGGPDDELVADVMARHSCGQHRLTRILKDLSGAL